MDENQGKEILSEPIRSKSDDIKNDHLPKYDELFPENKSSKELKMENDSSVNDIDNSKHISQSTEVTKSSPSLNLKSIDSKSPKQNKSEPLPNVLFNARSSLRSIGYSDHRKNKDTSNSTEKESSPKQVSPYYRTTDKEVINSTDSLVVTNTSTDIKSNDVNTEDMSKPLTNISSPSSYVISPKSKWTPRTSLSSPSSSSSSTSTTTTSTPKSPSSWNQKSIDSKSPKQVQSELLPNLLFNAKSSLRSIRYSDHRKSDNTSSTETKSTEKESTNSELPGDNDVTMNVVTTNIIEIINDTASNVTTTNETTTNATAPSSITTVEISVDVKSSYPITKEIVKSSHDSIDNRQDVDSNNIKTTDIVNIEVLSTEIISHDNMSIAEGSNIHDSSSVALVTSSEENSTIDNSKVMYDTIHSSSSVQISSDVQVNDIKSNEIIISESIENNVPEVIEAQLSIVLDKSESILVLKSEAISMEQKPNDDVIEDNQNSMNDIKINDNEKTLTNDVSTILQSHDSIDINVPLESISFINIDNPSINSPSLANKDLLQTEDIVEDIVEEIKLSSTSENIPSNEYESENKKLIEIVDIEEKVDNPESSMIVVDGQTNDNNEMITLSVSELNIFMEDNEKESSQAISLEVEVVADDAPHQMIEDDQPLVIDAISVQTDDDDDDDDVVIESQNTIIDSKTDHSVHVQTKEDLEIVNKIEIENKIENEKIHCLASDINDEPKTIISKIPGPSKIYSKKLVMDSNMKDTTLETSNENDVNILFSSENIHLITKESTNLEISKDKSKEHDTTIIMESQSNEIISSQPENSATIETTAIVTITEPLVVETNIIKVDVPPLSPSSSSSPSRTPRPKSQISKSSTSIVENLNIPVIDDLSNKHPIGSGDDDSIIIKDKIDELILEKNIVDDSNNLSTLTDNAGSNSNNDLTSQSLVIIKPIEKENISEIVIIDPVQLVDSKEVSMAILSTSSKPDYDPDRKLRPSKITPLRSLSRQKQRTDAYDISMTVTTDIPTTMNKEDSTELAMRSKSPRKSNISERDSSIDVSSPRRTTVSGSSSPRKLDRRQSSSSSSSSKAISLTDDPIAAITKSKLGYVSTTYSPPFAKQKTVKEREIHFDMIYEDRSSSSIVIEGSKDIIEDRSTMDITQEDMNDDNNDDDDDDDEKDNNQNNKHKDGNKNDDRFNKDDDEIIALTKDMQIEKGRVKILSSDNQVLAQQTDDYSISDDKNVATKNSTMIVKEEDQKLDMFVDSMNDSVMTENLSDIDKDNSNDNISNSINVSSTSQSTKSVTVDKKIQSSPSRIPKSLRKQSSKSEEFSSDKDHTTTISSDDSMNISMIIHDIVETTGLTQEDNVNQSIDHYITTENSHKLETDNNIRIEEKGEDMIADNDIKIEKKDKMKEKYVEKDREKNKSSELVSLSSNDDSEQNKYENKSNLLRTRSPSGPSTTSTTINGTTMAKDSDSHTPTQTPKKSNISERDRSIESSSPRGNSFSSIPRKLDRRQPSSSSSSSSKAISLTDDPIAAITKSKLGYVSTTYSPPFAKQKTVKEREIHFDMIYEDRSSSSIVIEGSKDIIEDRSTMDITQEDMNDDNNDDDDDDNKSEESVDTAEYVANRDLDSFSRDNNVLLEETVSSDIPEVKTRSGVGDTMDYPLSKNIDLIQSTTSPINLYSDDRNTNRVIETSGSSLRFIGDERIGIYPSDQLEVDELSTVDETINSEMTNPSKNKRVDTRYIDNEEPIDQSTHSDNSNSNNSNNNDNIEIFTRNTRSVSTTIIDPEFKVLTQVTEPVTTVTDLINSEFVARTERMEEDENDSIIIESLKPKPSRDFDMPASLQTKEAIAWMIEDSDNDNTQHDFHIKLSKEKFSLQSDTYYSEGPYRPKLTKRASSTPATKNRRYQSKADNLISQKISSDFNSQKDKEFQVDKVYRSKSEQKPKRSYEKIPEELILPPPPPPPYKHPFLKRTSTSLVISSPKKESPLQKVKSKIKPKGEKKKKVVSPVATTDVAVNDNDNDNGNDNQKKEDDSGRKSKLKRIKKKKKKIIAEGDIKNSPKSLTSPTSKNKSAPLISSPSSNNQQKGMKGYTPKNSSKLGYISTTFSFPGSSSSPKSEEKKNEPLDSRAIARAKALQYSKELAKKRKEEMEKALELTLQAEKAALESKLSAIEFYKNIPRPKSRTSTPKPSDKIPGISNIKRNQVDRSISTPHIGSIHHSNHTIKGTMMKTDDNINRSVSVDRPQSRRQIIINPTDQITLEKSSEEKLTQDAVIRAQLLKESKLAAKKLLEAKAKSLEEQRQKELESIQRRQLAKQKFSKFHVAPETEGFFSVHMINKIYTPNREKKLEGIGNEDVSGIGNSDNTVVEGKEQGEEGTIPSTPPVPTMSKEELTALRAEAEKQLRAQALLESKAAAKARFSATPKGKIAQQRSLSRTKSPKEAPVVVENTLPIDNNTAIESIVVVKEEQEQVVIPPRELTEEEKTKISEEASYASVDAAWAASKYSEAEQLYDSIKIALDRGKKCVCSIKSAMEQVDVKINQTESIKYDEQTDVLIQLILSTSQQSKELLDDTFKFSVDAENCSRSIIKSINIEEAMDYVTRISNAAEKASASSSSLKSLLENLNKQIDSIEFIDSQLRSDYNIPTLDLLDSLNNTFQEYLTKKEKKLLEEKENHEDSSEIHDSMFDEISLDIKNYNNGVISTDHMNVNMNMDTNTYQKEKRKEEEEMIIKTGDVKDHVVDIIASTSISMDINTDMNRNESSIMEEKNSIKTKDDIDDESEFHDIIFHEVVMTNENDEHNSHSHSYVEKNSEEKQIHSNEVIDDQEDDFEFHDSIFDEISIEIEKYNKNDNNDNTTIDSLDIDRNNKLEKEEELIVDIEEKEDKENEDEDDNTIEFHEFISKETLINLETQHKDIITVADTIEKNSDENLDDREKYSLVDIAHVEEINEANDMKVDEIIVDKQADEILMIEEEEDAVTVKENNHNTDDYIEKTSIYQESNLIQVTVELKDKPDIEISEDIVKKIVIETQVDNDRSNNISVVNSIIIDTNKNNIKTESDDIIEKNDDNSNDNHQYTEDNNNEIETHDSIFKEISLDIINNTVISEPNLLIDQENKEFIIHKCKEEAHKILHNITEIRNSFEIVCEGLRHVEESCDAADILTENVNNNHELSNEMEKLTKLLDHSTQETEELKLLFQRSEELNITMNQLSFPLQDTTTSTILLIENLLDIETKIIAIVVETTDLANKAKSCEIKSLEWRDTALYHEDLMRTISRTHVDAELKSHLVLQAKGLYKQAQEDYQHCQVCFENCKQSERLGIEAAKAAEVFAGMSESKEVKDAAQMSISAADSLRKELIICQSYLDSAKQSYMKCEETCNQTEKSTSLDDAIVFCDDCETFKTKVNESYLLCQLIETKCKDFEMDAVAAEEAARVISRSQSEHLLKYQHILENMLIEPKKNIHNMMESLQKSQEKVERCNEIFISYEHIVHEFPKDSKLSKLIGKLKQLSESNVVELSKLESFYQSALYSYHEFETLVDSYKSNHSIAAFAAFAFDSSTTTTVVDLDNKKLENIQYDMDVQMKKLNQSVDIIRLQTESCMLSIEAIKAIMKSKHDNNKLRQVIQDKIKQNLLSAQSHIHDYHNLLSTTRENLLSDISITMNTALSIKNETNDENIITECGKVITFGNVSKYEMDKVDEHMKEAERLCAIIEETEKFVSSANFHEECQEAADEAEQASFEVLQQVNLAKASFAAVKLASQSCITTLESIKTKMIEKIEKVEKMEQQEKGGQEKSSSLVTDHSTNIVSGVSTQGKEVEKRRAAVQNAIQEAALAKADSMSCQLSSKAANESAKNALDASLAAEELVKDKARDMKAYEEASRSSISASKALEEAKKANQASEITSKACEIIEEATRVIVETASSSTMSPSAIQHCLLAADRAEKARKDISRATYNAKASEVAAKLFEHAAIYAYESALNLIQLDKGINTTITSTLTSASATISKSGMNEGNKSSRQSTPRYPSSSSTLSRLSTISSKSSIIDEDVTMESLHTFTESYDSVRKLVKYMSELFDILTQFKCCKSNAEIFSGRLLKFSSILARLLKNCSNFPNFKFKVLSDTLCEKIFFAKRYFTSFTESGYLSSLLKGNETKSKFDEHDEHIFSMTSQFVSLLNGKQGSSINEIPSIKYNFMILTEANIRSAIQDSESLRALATLIETVFTDFATEVQSSLQRIDYLVQDINQIGPQRQIKHPAIRKFWYLYLESVYKLSNEEFIQSIQQYLISFTTEASPEYSSVFDLNNFIEKFKIVLNSQLYHRENDVVTVFDVNIWTKHMNSFMDMITILKSLLHQKALKLMPSIETHWKTQICWGLNDRDKPIQKSIEKSLRKPGRWTIVCGLTQSGKSYRWLLGAHMFIPDDQSIIWLDFKSIRSTNEMLSSIASQLSLCVLSLDEVMFEFQTMIEKSIDYHRVCILLDHFDFSKLNIFSKFLGLFSKLEKKNNLVMVIISTEENIPSSKRIHSLCKVADISENSICYEWIKPLSNEDGLRLAKYFQVFEPVLLVEAAKCLPGYIVNMQALPMSSLIAIIHSADSEITSPISSPSSRRPSISLTATSIYPLSPRIHNTRDIVIADNLTKSECLCTYSLYYPLCDGIIFSRAVAWKLCIDTVENNIDVLDSCLNRLVAVGWLKKISDEGYMIGSASCLPSHSIVTINEAHQWSTYYQYWIHEAIRINNILRSKDQLLACAYYDSSRKHFEALFDSLCATPVLHDSLSPIIVRNLVSQLSMNISNISDYRISPKQSLRISKAILRILCSGDDSGRFVDHRYWEDDIHMKTIILKATINLSWDHYRTGDISTSEMILTSTLQYLKESDNTMMEIYLFALNKLAIVYRSQERLEEALDTHQKCFKLRCEVLGYHHIDTAQSMNNIAIVLTALGRKDEAIQMHQQCVHVRIEILGIKHASVGDSYFNIGNILISFGQYKEALESYQKAKLAYMSAYGQRHSYVLDIDKKIHDTTKLLEGRK